jgi:hypothetical protein
MLQTLANLAQILGAVAVIAGIAFGFTQVRQFRQQRQDAVLLEMRAQDLDGPVLGTSLRMAIKSLAVRTILNLDVGGS